MKNERLWYCYIDRSLDGSFFYGTSLVEGICFRCGEIIYRFFSERIKIAFTMLNQLKEGGVCFVAAVSKIVEEQILPC